MSAAESEMVARALPAEIDQAIVELNEQAAAIARKLRPLNDAWGRKRWSRYFFVPGGHVHSSTSCSSCYSTTSFVWLPERSGETVAAIVEHFGERTCSVCMPSAPTFPRFAEPSRDDLVEREAKREKAAHRNSKAAARMAKRAERKLTAAIADGLELLRFEGTRSQVQNRTYLADKVQAAREALTELAELRNSSRDEELAAANKRARARWMREGWHRTVPKLGGPETLEGIAWENQALGTLR